MSEPIIFNDIDFQSSDQDNRCYLRYMGNLFSGRIFITGNNDKGNEIIDYYDGHAHGHDLIYYADGKIAADKVYEYGCCVSQKQWYNDGKPKLEWDATNDHRWDCDGILAKDNTRWLYKNGQPIEEQINNQTSYFSLSGSLAIKKVYTDLGNGRCCYIYYYYDHVLNLCFKDLFTNYYPDLDEQFLRQQLLPDWINAVYKEDHDKGKHLIDCLINHPTPQIRETALRLKNAALIQGNVTDQAANLHPPQPDHIIVKLNFDTRF